MMLVPVIVVATMTTLALVIAVTKVARITAIIVVATIVTSAEGATMTEGAGRPPTARPPQLSPSLRSQILKTTEKIFKTRPFGFRLL